MANSGDQHLSSHTLVVKHMYTRLDRKQKPINTPMADPPYWVKKSTGAVLVSVHGEGTELGAPVGMVPVGARVGCPVGWHVGCPDGTLVGSVVGVPVGWVGIVVGCPVGIRDGCPVGSLVGSPVGAAEGCPVGTRDGCPVGSPVGAGVGA